MISIPLSLRSLPLLLSMLAMTSTASAEEPASAGLTDNRFLTHDTMLKCVPESSKARAEGFHHFKPEYQSVLEKHFQSNGVMFLRTLQRE